MSKQCIQCGVYSMRRLDKKGRCVNCRIASRRRKRMKQLHDAQMEQAHEASLRGIAEGDRVTFNLDSGWFPYGTIGRVVKGKGWLVVRLEASPGEKTLLSENWTKASLT